MKTIIEVLIDVSGSMAEELPSGKIKIDLVKEILTTKIFPNLSYSESIGIRLFGGHCEIINEVENIPQASFNKLKKFIETQLPIPNGSTPLALAIKTAVDNLKKDPSADKEIYLLTDGEDTCGGDIIEASEYAASNGINCKIHIIGIGNLSELARHQFEIISSKTGGKNINIAVNNTTKSNIDREINKLFHSDIDDIVNLIDTEYSKRKETFKYYDNKSIKEYLFRKNLPINYIPSDQAASCQNTLVIEYYNEDDISNLINGLKHVENCNGINKEVLILMKNWNNEIDSQIMKQWYNQFKNKGIAKFCVKLEGFKSYKELNI
jgi:hypothetical protein